MKNNQPLIFFKQIFSIITIIIIIYIFLYKIRTFKSLNLIIVMFSYFLIVLSITILPTIKKVFNYDFYIQKLLAILPFFIIPIPPLIITCGIWTYHNIIINLIGILFILLMVIFEKKENENILNGIYSKIPLGKKDFLIELFFTTLSIIAEEFWFKYILISNISPLFKEGGVLISSILFVYIHYLGRWANLNYTIKSYIRLFIFSMISGMTYYLTGLLFFSIVMHLIFNIIAYIVLIKRSFFVSNKEVLFDDYE